MYALLHLDVEYMCTKSQLFTFKTVREWGDRQTDHTPYPWGCRYVNLSTLLIVMPASETLSIWLYKKNTEIAYQHELKGK